MNIFDIPYDCWSVIWYFSTYHELFRVRQTCHHFHRQSNETKLNKFWKIQCRHLLSDVEPNYKTSSWFNTFVEIHRFTRHIQVRIQRRWSHTFVYAPPAHMQSGISTAKRVIAACELDCPRLLNMYLSNSKNQFNVKQHISGIRTTTNMIKNGCLLKTCVIHGSFNCLKYLFKTFFNELEFVLDSLINGNENDLITIAMNGNDYNICKCFVENVCKLKKLNKKSINTLRVEYTRTRNFAGYERNLLHYFALKHKDSPVIDVQFIKLLVSNGGDLLITDSNGCTPFLLACKHYNYKLIRGLLETAKATDNIGNKILFNAKKAPKDKWYSIIFWCAENIDSDMMEYFLRVSIEIGLIDVAQNEHILLGEKGILNATRNQDFSPLTAAIDSNYFQVVQCLVSKFNVDVNRMDNQNVCFLFWHVDMFDFS